MFEDNKAAILTAHQLINRGGSAVRDKALNNLAAPDFIGHADGLTFDREALKYRWRQLFTVFPDVIFTLDHVVAEGDNVAYWRRARGTQEGYMHGCGASKEILTWTTVVTSRFSGGCIVEKWMVSDLHDVLHHATKPRQALDSIRQPAQWSKTQSPQKSSHSAT